MLKMKRMLEERRDRKKMARGDGVGEGAGGEAASASAPVATADAIPAATTATTATTMLTSQQKVHQREEEQPRPKRPRNKYAHLVEREGAEARPLSKSKQRKKEFLRNRKKGKKGKDRDGDGDGEKGRDASSDEEAGGNVDRVAFGEQADAPMKEVLRSKHWAEKPKREGVDPAVSIVGLGAAMGARRVAGMGSRALAALYRDQKRSKMGGGEGGEGHARATRESLKQLVRQGNGQ